MRKLSLFTIGHSTRTIDDFIGLLETYAIKRVVDVRTIPKSRRNPQFHETALQKSLEEAGIHYIHLAELGGLRHARKDSVNTGWRNASFRGYADHMATEEFAVGLETLMGLAAHEPTAIMCAEAVPWRCHRSLIGDALAKKGWLVRDIMSQTQAPRHRLTPFLKVRKDALVYPEPEA